MSTLSLVSKGLLAMLMAMLRGLTNGGSVGALAEMASCQLEYTYLAKVTGKKEFYDKVSKLLANSVSVPLNIRYFQSANIMRTLERVDLSKLGMLPKNFNLESGTPLGGKFHTHVIFKI